MKPRLPLAREREAAAKLEREREAAEKLEMQYLGLIYHAGIVYMYG